MRRLRQAGQCFGFHPARIKTHAPHGEVGPRRGFDETYEMVDAGRLCDGTPELPARPYLPRARHIVTHAVLQKRAVPNIPVASQMKPPMKAVLNARLAKGARNDEGYLVGIIGGAIEKPDGKRCVFSERRVSDDNDGGMIAGKQVVRSQKIAAADSALAGVNVHCPNLAGHFPQRSDERAGSGGRFDKQHIAAGPAVFHLLGQQAGKIGARVELIHCRTLLQILLQTLLQTLLRSSAFVRESRGNIQGTSRRRQALDESGAHDLPRAPPGFTKRTGPGRRATAPAAGAYL